MGIGGALAEARSEAGLTVADVSARTRIRATIIRAIEQDDYSVCGGDFYARGHIRAIARAVGTDPAPLIEQYDVAHTPPPGPAAGGTGPVRPAGITAAEAFRPAMPLPFERPRRLSGRARLVGLLVLVVSGVLAYLLVQGSAPARPRPHQTASSTHHAAAAGPQPSAAATPPPGPLPVATVEAFGPQGPSQGDSPQLARLAVDGNPSTAWHSDWYATADFNGNQSGTGLLLDMGQTVTVTSAQLTLGPGAGGTVQLRVGNTPSLAGLPVLAAAPDPGGALTLQVSTPVAARYVLIWFTQLPPDGRGTYQAWVYNVSLSGTA